ncbi:MAG: hypothetical protein REI78_03795 [Pedobacter sp.]|nr:hypothetical protein [Pedobacter sp.]MDQ8052119.1 hypothetical protein [Pedobacter sp.]
MQTLIRKYILHAILFFQCVALKAQQNYGPKITAMANNSAAVADVWSVNGNPALITYVEQPILALNHHHYGTEELSLQAISFVIPTRNDALGFYFQRYGIDEYHELKISSAFAKRWGNQFCMALRFNYAQLHIKNYGSAPSYAFDIGLGYAFSEHFSLGLYTNNPFQLKNTPNINSVAMPGSIYLGCSYLISDQVAIATTLSSMANSGFNSSIGMDYQLAKFLRITAGISLRPFQHFFGFGLLFKQWRLEFAMAQNPLLVDSPQIGIAYAF